jgi:hypothetical protein
LVVDLIGSMRYTVVGAREIARAFFATANPNDEFQLLTVSYQPQANLGRLGGNRWCSIAVKVWDLATGRSARKLQGLPSPFYGLAFASAELESSPAYQAPASDKLNSRQVT